MLPLWLVGALAAVLIVLLLSRLATSTTIYEFERGLRFTRGRFAGVLGPGTYWHLPRTTRILKTDVRPTQLAVAGQEVLTSDGVAVKASVVATYQVVDPERAVLGVASYQTALHTEVQLALRAVISGLAVEDLLEKRPELSAQLKSIAAERVRAVGVELQDAAIRDLTFPGELKKIFGQVVKARQEGLAALEKARAESAALRNLANAAQMVQRHPELMQLRLLQILGQQPGNTVVLGMQQAAGAPIPIRERGPGPDELPSTEGGQTDA